MIELEWYETTTVIALMDVSDADAALRRSWASTLPGTIDDRVRSIPITRIQ